MALEKAHAKKNGALPPFQFLKGLKCNMDKILYINCFSRIQERYPWQSVKEFGRNHEINRHINA